MKTLISLLITLFTPVGFDPTQTIRCRKGLKANNSTNIAKYNNNINNS